MTLPNSNRAGTAGTAKAILFTRSFWDQGRDIRMLGFLLVVAGVFDVIWISAYPHYALKIFGTTFTGWPGEVVKYQHPFIHWILGYGFWEQRPWAWYGYLIYLGVGCLSEVVTQMVNGFHPTRTTMIVVSLLFGSYIIFRRSAFRPFRPVAA